MNKICKTCDGRCCKTFDYVAIDPDDKNEVKRLTKLGADITFDGDECVMNVQGGCQFLKKNRCSIYRKRPRACKKWRCEKLWNKDYDKKPKFLSRNEF